MRVFNWLLAVAAILCVSITSAHATTDDEAKQAIQNYVRTLQTPAPTGSGAKSATVIRASTSKYPVIAKLGPITSAMITARDQFANTEVFTALLRHRYGSSKWQFKMAENGINITSVQMLSAEFNQGGWGWSDRDRWHSGRSGQTKGWSQGTARSNPRAAPPPSIPPSNPCKDQPALCKTTANNPDDPRLVEFLYATDRKLSITNNIATLADDSGRSGKLSFGVAAVRIPEDHEEGLIELPSEWRLFGITFRSDPNDKKHFSIKRLTETSLDDWKDLARRHRSKSAIVFVHGFNTSFTDALYRNAQITWDLNFRGLSVLYSWSSKGQTADYLYDRDSAEIAEHGFIELLNILRNDIGVEHVSVIAHSMGNRVVMNALRNNANTAKPVSLHHLVLAAPDIASDDFANKLPVVRELTQGATLYASSADKALKLSGELASFPRAGDVPVSGPIVLPKLDTIDVTKVGDDVLGLNHNVFATNRSVMDDIKLLLIDGMALPRLTQVRKVPEPPAIPTYWQFR